MGIQITTADSLPAIIYNRVHLLRLEVDQVPFQDDTKPPVYFMRITYRLFGVVNGVRYYKDDGAKEIVIPDYLSVAMADAAAGDMALLNALQAIEVGIAAVLTDQGVTAGVI